MKKFILSIYIGFASIGLILLTVMVCISEFYILFQVFLFGGYIIILGVLTEHMVKWGIIKITV